MRMRVGVYMRARVNGQGRGIHLEDYPVDTGNAAHGWVGERVEGCRREVEIAVLASPTPVCQLDVDGLSLEGNPSSLATQRVLVRVHAI